MRHAILAGVAIMTAMCAGPAGAQTLTVANEFLTVSHDTASGKLTLVAAGASAPFAKDAALSQAGGKAKIIDVSDKTFGQCKGIEVAYPDGGRDLVLTPAKLPFALLCSTVHNGTKEAAIPNRVRPAAFTLDLGAPASELKVLGTGGLTAADKKPGSYMWLAVAEPKTRRGIVAGWITTDRGSGAVFAEQTGQAVRVTGQIDYGRLKIAPGARETLETLAIGYFDDVRLGLAPDKLHAAFDFWANAMIPPFKGSLAGKLPKHTCRVLAIREVTDRPAVLGTSRHITQGVVDIVSETWDPAARTLAGTSKVVAGDPYELRVPTTSTAGAWKSVAAEVSAADRAAGASVSMKVAGDLCRVTINSAAGRDVKWKVVFDPPSR